MRIQKAFILVLATALPAPAVFAAQGKKKQQVQETLYDEDASDPLLDALAHPDESDNEAPRDDSRWDSRDGKGRDGGEDLEPDATKEEPARRPAARTKQSEGVSRIVEVGLFPSALVKDYPISGGFSVGSELLVHTDLWMYVSFEMSNYSDLNVNPVLNGAPDDNGALTLPTLDHTSINLGGRYYLKADGGRQLYVGGSLGVGGWEGNYHTDDGQKFKSSVQEIVLSAEGGYRWLIAEDFSFRLGLGLGLALPLQNEVKSSGDAAAESLADEVRDLDFYQFRPAILVGLGYAY